MDRPDTHSQHDDGAVADLQAAASRHLWGHFTRMGAVQRDPMPIITRGEGNYVFDQTGHRLLDGLSGLFTVQAGHGRREIAEAATTQAATLGYFPLWSFSHEPGIRLAQRLAALAPGDLNRVFFTTGGGEAVETAWKLAVQYFAAIGQPMRRKVISRHYAYHGTTLGALSITGVPAIKNIWEPLLPGAVKVMNTNSYRAEEGADPLAAANDIEARILMEGPETVACIVLEPVQNTGGALVPPAGYFERVREICDRYGVLLVSDEVICGFGRLGHWFGCQRFGFQPDMIVFAKGVTSGYAPLGGLIVSDRLAAPFLEGDRVFLHGLTFGGHPVSCAVALANLDVLEREDLPGNVARNEHVFDEVMARIGLLPIVGDVRGCGYFRVAELVKDKATKTTFDDDECEWLLRDVLSPALYRAGLFCRADDRADPVLVLAPPLTCGPQELQFIGDTVVAACSDAWDAFRSR
jgi:adenosylmethionine-8-amino-7-oxononanoate aminotransferase